MLVKEGSELRRSRWEKKGSSKGSVICVVYCDDFRLGLRNHVGKKLSDWVQGGLQG